MRRRLTGIAAAIGLALLAAAPAAAQGAGKRNGWADEVKRSLDKPDREAGEMTGSTGRESRESPRPHQTQRPVKGQSPEPPRF